MNLSSNLSALLGGAALTLSLCALWALTGEARRRDDTTYRDKPPALFRWLWPVVLLAGSFTQWVLKRESRAARIKLRLVRGGVDYALTPVHFFSGKLVYAALASLTGAVLSAAVNQSPWGAVLLGGGVGFHYPDLWLSEQIKRRRLALLKALPFFLDIVTLGVESGLNLAGALQKAVDKTKPGPLTGEMNRVMRDVRAGRARVDALRDLADRLDFAPITSLISAMVQGELMGSSLGPILRAQSDQRRTERFQRAEKMAMEAPVKMLGPLVMFIFPCTFVVIGFPIVVKFLSSGI